MIQNLKPFLNPLHAFGYIQGAYNLLRTERVKEKWGIIDAKKGKNIVNISSFLECERISENEIVSESVEEGSFATYNKVEAPAEIKALIAVEGTLSQLQDTLVLMDKYVSSTDLINVVTPTFEYIDYNLERYDYQLKQSLGRGILYLDLYLIEVRQVKTKYSNVKIAPVKNRGLVQAKKTTTDSVAKGQVKQGKKQSMLHMATGKIPNPWNK